MNNIGLPARVILSLAGVILIWGSPGEIGARSKAYKSYADETSFMALQLRALGALKLGVGISLIGASLLGVSTEESQQAAHQIALEAASRTKPAAPVVKPVMPPKIS